MPRFNAPVATATKTTNFAGGEAFVESPKLEFVSMLLTSMVQDQFYRKADASISRLRELLAAVDPLFAAKAAVYARNEYGMRSISHVVAGELAYRVKGEQWMRPFYRTVVRRADDITEIMAYYVSNYGKRPIPNSLKDGLAQAMGKFDEYALSKYRGDGKAFKQVDIANITHPHPTERNAAALKGLIDGTLRSTETWEAKLTQAGKAETDEETAELKTAAWGDLIRSRKLGYFALLRNLRNIMAQAPDTLSEALTMLVDETLIRKSLVLPFRYMTAYKEVEKLPASQPVLNAINTAATVACANVPTFEGRTLVALDVSGSMANGRVSTTSPAEIGTLFTAVLARQGVDVLLFSDDAAYLTLGGRDLFGDIETIRRHTVARGTNFNAIFEKASAPYDRIIILSDMQAWMTDKDNFYNIGGNPAKSFAAYKTKYGCNPHVYSFDLQGLGTLQFPQHNVYALAGFSERVFDVMGALEQDRNALIAKIEAISFN